MSLKAKMKIRWLRSVEESWVRQFAEEENLGWKNFGCTELITGPVAFLHHVDPANTHHHEGFNTKLLFFSMLLLLYLLRPCQLKYKLDKLDIGIGLI